MPAYLVRIIEKEITDSPHDLLDSASGRLYGWELFNLSSGQVLLGYSKRDSDDSAEALRNAFASIKDNGLVGKRRSPLISKAGTLRKTGCVEEVWLSSLGKVGKSILTLNGEVCPTVTLNDFKYLTTRSDTLTIHYTCASGEVYYTHQDREDSKGCPRLGNTVEDDDINPKYLPPYESIGIFTTSLIPVLTFLFPISYIPHSNKVSHINWILDTVVSLIYIYGVGTWLTSDKRARWRDAVSLRRSQQASLDTFTKNRDQGIASQGKPLVDVNTGGRGYYPESASTESRPIKTYQVGEDPEDNVEYVLRALYW